MAKEKVAIKITDVNDKVLATFTTKTLTSLFNNLSQGTVVDVSFDEGKNFGEQFVGNYIVKGLPNDPTTPPPSHECPAGQHWDDSQNKCIDDIIIPTCPAGEHYDTNAGKCVPDLPPQCPPGQHIENGVCVPDVTPPTGDLLYSSHRDTKLHDGQVRTVKNEGNISAGGLGVECRASGNPRIQVNADDTFSLLCDGGHGRLYFYVLNYNATLKIEAAFWNDGSGQDMSLKMRSRHNEGSACENRFGGYGLAVDRSGYDAKREICHNIHDESESGSLPNKPQTKEYFTIEFTVKDEGGKVSQIGKMNGKEFMNKTDSSPKPYMQDLVSFAKQSYFWVRQNITSGTGELRIKSLEVLKV